MWILCSIASRTAANEIWVLWLSMVSMTGFSGPQWENGIKILSSQLTKSEVVMYPFSEAQNTQFGGRVSTYLLVGSVLV